MHFSKTYAQLLTSLPPELRASAIEYRHLKKLINQVVEELTSLGLPPQLLQQVLEESQAPRTPRSPTSSSEDNQESSSEGSVLPRITYEVLDKTSDEPPRLRLRTFDPELFSGILVAQRSGESVPIFPSDTLDNVSQDAPTPGLSVEITTPYEYPREIIIPLASDSIFIQTLVHAHQSLSDHLSTFCDEFYANLATLAQAISDTARPMSQTYPGFHAHSSQTNASMVRVRSPGGVLSLVSHKTDLYAWREVLQLYMDAEVFEDTHEESRGERAIADAEERMAKLMRTLRARGLSNGRCMKLKESKHAMQLFLQLNASILNLYKFQYATTEATRKILKKHAKRTSLPFTTSLPATFSVPEITPESSPNMLVAVSRRSTTSLARSLVQAIGETVLPIVPAVDDYNCIICMNIAFKPIRLHCGHLFCVRCLVKMQKRGQANCPMCRTPCVLTADRSNVDWALLNFMTDWFPVESQQKLRANEEEVTKEQMAELGIQSPQCTIQ